jgi:hypothetical protein
MRTKKPAEPTKSELRELAIRVVRQKAEAQALEFFHDTQRKAFATVPVADHRETWRIRSSDFRLWVMQVLYEQLGSAPKKLVTECLDEFETRAICRGKEFDVHVRVAEHNGAIYIDLANCHWQVLEVSEKGWRILDQSPVKFRRAKGMTSLPHPQDGGSFRDISRFLNIDAQSEVLLLAWLTYALRPNTPYPIIALSGVQGAGKSTITKVLRNLIDPSVAALTTAPKSERDAAIAATNSHLIAMDNMSEISPELSDIMCRVATGGSLRTRTLYTDDDETIFTYRRPQIINGIELLPTRPDLLDRSILIHVEPITEERRRDDQNFWSDFERIRPQVFGSMLDIICEGLRRLPHVLLSSSPRMADFTRWGVAVEQAMGYQSEAFLVAYRSNREDANAAALDSSPIAEAIYRFLEKNRQVFRGTALQLLSRLRIFLESSNSEHPEIAQLLKHPKFPKSANQLSEELMRIKPNMKKRGIAVNRGRTHSGRFLHLERVTVEDTEPKRDRRVNPDNAPVTAQPKISLKVAAGVTM